MSRQFQWALKQMASGNCKQCGTPRGKSRAFCQQCLDKENIRQRQARYPEVDNKIILLAYANGLTVPQAVEAMRE